MKKNMGLILRWSDIDVKLNDEGAEENQGKNDEEWIENGVAIGLEVVELNEAVLAGDL